jgi:hypothetical protein
MDDTQNDGVVVNDDAVVLPEEEELELSELSEDEMAEDDAEEVEETTDAE